MRDRQVELRCTREARHLTGRLVDNAGFIAVENVDTLSDGPLYELLLSECPDWPRAARTACVLR
nr:VWA domain-containing protein [Rhodococcus oxybenzonivorans]